MKVSMRNGFSDRNAIKPENVDIQLYEFDKRTRIQLGNMVSSFYAVAYGDEYYKTSKAKQTFLRYVLGTIYAEPVDVHKIYNEEAILEVVTNTIMSDSYDDVLTVLEGVINQFDNQLIKTLGYSYYYNGKYRSTSIFEKANAIFEKEYIGYRFIDGLISPISDEYELSAINEAISNKYRPVQNHLTKATQLLSNRETPDYENSIKESISSVEAMCEIILGVTGKEATLGSMLKRLESNGVVIHGALKSAFSALYGYTSDANGIRHAGDIGGASSTFEEAKFMLVACSAFINYLSAINAD